MAEDYHRHDISDEVWALLEPHLLGRKGTWGGNARDNRKFINAVFWILQTGSPWRGLPPNYGSIRHLVENAFLKLKHWRGIATRYAKNTSSFVAVLQIRCIALWAEILA